MPRGKQRDFVSMKLQGHQEESRDQCHPYHNLQPCNPDAMGSWECPSDFSL